MPKFLLPNRAQGQATSAPNASATSITLTASGDTSEFTADGSPTATAPISAILTDVADITAPTLVETVLITNITGDVFTITRDADGNGAQDFSAGNCFITVASTGHLLGNMLQRDSDTASRIGGVPVDITANISANALAADYAADGSDYLYVTLSASSTAISVVEANIPVGAALRLEVFGGGTWAPVLTGMTTWLKGVQPTLSAANIIFAEKLGDGTVRYIDGGEYAA